MIRRYALALSALLSLALPGQAATLYVSKTGDDTTGATWGTAFNLVGSALTSAASGDEIWVATGTYAQTIEMVTGVSLYGGFAGTESSLQQRDPETYISKLTQSATIEGPPIITCSVDCAIDGLTIAGGNAIRGGGVYIRNATVSLLNCVIDSNVARREGGGIFAVHSDLPPT